MAKDLKGSVAVFHVLVVPRRLTRHAQAISSPLLPERSKRVRALSIAPPLCTAAEDLRDFPIAQA